MIPRTSRVVKEAHVTTSEGLEHDVLCDCMLVVFQDCIKIQDA